MISKHDECLCHQIVSTFDHVDTSDRQWYERAWLVTHDNSGEIMVDTGFGKYTNRNVMDAFGGVALRGTSQYTVRASRELRPNVDSLVVGPLSYEIIEPLVRYMSASKITTTELALILNLNLGCNPTNQILTSHLSMAL